MMTEKTAEMLDEIIASNPHKIVLGGGKGEYRKIVCGKKQISGKLVYQLEKYTDKQVFHENIGEEDLKGTLGGYIGENFRQLNSFAVGYDYELRVSKKGEPHLTRKKSDKKQVTIQGNNRKKKYILEEGMDIPVFKELGIFTKDGKVAKPMYDKFKQINRFVEMVDDVLKDYDGDEIYIIDFGCGKSYLTFILYYYLVEIRKKRAYITGLDLKEQVIKNCNALAEKFGYKDLRFEIGNINGYHTDHRVDMVVSLHACDTATDFALYNAISWGATYIMSVPCCQHEANKQMKTEALKGITHYGLIKERTAALMTDTIRGLMLEYSGYKTDVMEFIEIEHSPKNILIRAVKKNISEAKRKEAYKQAEEICLAFDLKQCLMELLKTREDNGYRG